MEPVVYGDKLQLLIDKRSGGSAPIISKSLIVSLIELMGGEQQLLTSVSSYDIETEIGTYAQLDKDAVVDRFFKENRIGIIQHLSDIAPRFDKESAVEFVEQEMRGTQNCDAVAEAFFSSTDSISAVPSNSEIRRFAIAYCLDCLHMWYIHME